MILVRKINLRYTVYMKLSWQKIYAFSKEVHRLAMWVAIILGVPLAITGLLLHKIVEGEWLNISFIDPAMVRFLHNKLSTPFALILALMMVTGFVMWGVPKLLMWQRKRNAK